MYSRKIISLITPSKIASNVLDTIYFLNRLDTKYGKTININTASIIEIHIVIPDNILSNLSPNIQPAALSALPGSSSSS